MGRELKRVPLDFDWPLDRIWKGYQNPYWQYAKKCPECKGKSYTKDVRELADDWYGFDRPENRWQEKLEIEEVQALLDNKRVDKQVIKQIGKDPETYKIATPELVKLVNELAHQPVALFLGLHDSIGMHICLEARAKKLGYIKKDIKEAYCPNCEGEGNVFEPPEMKEKYATWEREHPPKGDGYQVWETVSEGSPQSPVFPNKKELIAWLILKGYSPEAAENFANDGWSPTMTATVTAQGGELKNDIESCA